MWQLEQVRWEVIEGEWRGAGGCQTHIEGRMNGQGLGVDLVGVGEEESRITGF